MRADPASVNRVPKREDIEGLRAVAILLVVLYHAHVPGIGGGFVGVDVFFALSGYLITGLLLKELEQQGTADLVSFYARRAKRLLPAAATTILASLAAAWVLLGPLDQQSYTGAGLAAALYVSNFWFARNATDYLAAPPDTNPFLHLWSLAVEEQFYLAWPAVVVVTWRLVPTRGRGVVVLISVASLILTLLLQQAGAAHWAFFASPARAWEFGAGAVGALSTRGGPAWLGWLGLAGIALPASLYSASTAFPGLAAIPPVVGTVLILVVRGPTLERGLGWRPLQVIGGLSYGWYLWHWPMIVFARVLFPGLSVPAQLLCSILSLGIAAACHVLIESPLRSSVWLTHRPRTTLVGACALTLVVLGASWSWRSLVRTGLADPAIRAFVEAREEAPRIYENGCHLRPDESEIRPCSFGIADADIEMVLWGDSHAAQWFPSLERAATDAGWRLETITKSGCPPADLPVSKTCDRWRQDAVRRIKDLSPDLLILANANVYLSGGDSRLASTTALAFRSAMSRTLDAVAGVPTLVLSPIFRPGFDVPMCLARAVWRPWLGAGCGFEPLEPLTKSLEEQAAEGRFAVHFADFSHDICTASTCPPEMNGQIVYRDDHHLTPRFNVTLAPLVQAELTRQLAIAGSRSSNRSAQRARTGAVSN